MLFGTLHHPPRFVVEHLIDDHLAARWGLILMFMSPFEVSTSLLLFTDAQEVEHILLSETLREDEDDGQDDSPPRHRPHFLPHCRNSNGKCRFRLEKKTNNINKKQTNTKTDRKQAPPAASSPTGSPGPPGNHFFAQGPLFRNFGPEFERIDIKVCIHC